jgi:hypothetical protein
MRSRHEKSSGAVRRLTPTTNSAGGCLRVNGRQERRQLATVQYRPNMAGSDAVQLFREIRERHCRRTITSFRDTSRLHPRLSSRETLGVAPILHGGLVTRLDGELPLPFGHWRSR